MSERADGNQPDGNRPEGNRPKAKMRLWLAVLQALRMAVLFVTTEHKDYCIRCSADRL